MSSLLAGGNNGQLLSGEVHNLTFNDQRLSTFDCTRREVSTADINTMGRGIGEGRRRDGELTFIHSELLAAKDQQQEVFQIKWAEV